MRRRRGLSADEAELWARVVEKANRLNSEAAAAPPGPPSPDPEVSVPRPPRVLSRPARSGKGSVTLDLKPTVSEHLAAQHVNMDRRKFGKLRRGKLAPEARLDLHGMSQSEAHSELTAFILLSRDLGRRLVLVITGKGGPHQAGVLRQQVPHWLNLPPLRACVQQIVEAHIRHGGAGALYVYLRRGRGD